MNEQYTRAPHQKSSSSSSGSGPSPNAALLIDFDNVTMAMRSNLGQELRNFLNSDIVRGKVSVQRAYADWRRYPQYIVPLSEASIDLIFAPAYGSSKKNATDIRLAIDALELVFTRPKIETYILLSGDSDFSSLVLKLKEYGKYVIGVGLQESSSDLLVQNCDEYYSYNSLSGLTSADEMSTRSKDPWDLVERAVHRMADRDDVMRSDRLKQVMLEIDAGFDEKDHGFNKFNRFLAEASSRGLVKLRKIGDGQYEVKPAGPREDGGPQKEEDDRAGEPEPDRRQQARRQDRREDRSRREPAREASRKKGRASGGSKKPSRGSRGSGGGVDASALRSAYDLLADVVGDLADGDEPVRDSEVKREMLRRRESFDEAALGFSKFSRFLRQAHDEEVVDVAKDDDGNYYLAPAGSGAAERAAAGAEDGRPDRRSEEPEAVPTPESGAATAEPGSGEADAPGDGGRPGTAAPAETGDGEDAAPGDGGEPGTETRERTQEEAGAETAGAGRGGSSRRRGRGLGRGRRGSRGRSGTSGSGSDDEDGEAGAAAPGPVDTGDREEPGEQDGADEGDRQADGPSGRGGRRSRGRGLGRFRSGSRGKGSPAGSDGDGSEPSVDSSADEDPRGAAEEESADGPAAGSQGASGADAGSRTAAGEASPPPVPEDADDDPVGYMIGTYPGVGRKTAEKLVEAFGDEVFEVIDREPERLTEVLPEHRARAVVDAREAEREQVEA